MTMTPNVAGVILAAGAASRMGQPKLLLPWNGEALIHRVARIALEAGLTGEARHQAEAAQAAGLNQRRLWLLLAEIEEEERGDTEAGRMVQRDALRRAASADPDPGWTCSVCHTAHPVWQAACPACATPGSLRWGGSGPVVASVPAIL